MNIKIKRFDKSLPLPKYQTSGAAAFDLYAREDVVIPPGEVVLVPLNIALQLPPTHWALMTARSSLHKKGLTMANGVGVGDADYCGDGDEYRAALFNFTQKKVELKQGDRIVQMLILQREQVEFEELDSLENPDRGGFGSTG
jgi:dUTP pyrophosphatase